MINAVECVILNACYSEIQAGAIAQHIEYVIGMDKAIGDKIAIEFAVAFYDALGAGESIEFAYKLACNAIRWTNISEHLKPILKSKPLINANKDNPLEVCHQEHYISSQFAELHAKWSLLHDSLSRLEHSKIIEIRSEEKLHLQEQIDQLADERERIEQQLTILQTQLLSNSIDFHEQYFQKVIENQNNLPSQYSNIFSGYKKIIVAQPHLHLIPKFIESAIAQAQKTNMYEKTIELIDSYIDTNETVLTKDVQSQLILKEAILFQQDGDILNAYNAIKAYERLAGNDLDVEYFICKGKLISQITKSPTKLDLYISNIKDIDIFQNPENKKALSSLYWRVSVLWQMYDIEKSRYYLSIHKDFSEIGSYQIPNNYQFNALAQIIKLSDEKLKIGGNKINNSIDILLQAFEHYAKVENFNWLDKCIISNILMMALVDKLGRRPLSFYKKVFYVRKLFSLNHITPNDEAISEILFVIKKIFPEVFEIVFTENIGKFIKNHALSDMLREIYLDVETEFIDYSYNKPINMVELYKSLTA